MRIFCLCFVLNTLVVLFTLHFGIVLRVEIFNQIYRNHCRQFPVKVTATRVQWRVLLLKKNIGKCPGNIKFLLFVYYFRLLNSLDLINAPESFVDALFVSVSYEKYKSCLLDRQTLEFETNIRSMLIRFKSNSPSLIYNENRIVISF